MFCLRSWIPLLFIPTNAPPIFILLFLLSTFYLSRPCLYCSFLLVVLFITSCNWSDRCYFEIFSNWFIPRSASLVLSAPPPSMAGVSSLPSSSLSSTWDAATALAQQAAQQALLLAHNASWPPIAQNGTISAGTGLVETSAPPANVTVDSLGKLAALVSAVEGSLVGWLGASEPDGAATIGRPRSESPDTINGGGGGGGGGTTDMAQHVATYVFRSYVVAAVDKFVGDVVLPREGWSGLGIGWLRSVVGRGEWHVECLDVTIRL